MAGLIALVLVAAIVYVMFESCAFNNHTYEVIERDEEHDCHRLKCVKCGREVYNDPYEGICG